jgi:hypothetical protein
MRQQIVRIIDPSNLSSNLNLYREDGKRMLRLLKKTNVDKSIRDEMRVFLATRDSLFKKTALNKEISRFANPLYIAGFGAETLGLYNPDTIPVDTYVKMKTDSQVAIGLAMIKMPLYSLNWGVDCEDPDIREFVKEALALIWKKLIRSMLTAVDFGFASHELVWEMKDLDVYTHMPTGRKKTHFKGKAEVLKKIKGHYPGSVRIRMDAKTDEFLGISQQVMGEMISLDADKCFLFTLNDEFGQYFGQSRLKAAYKPWYWREVLTQFMLRYFERKGSPTTVVTHPIGGGIDPDGTTYDNSDIALRIGQNIVENGTVTLPFEAEKSGPNKWSAQYLQDDRRGEMFVNALNYLGVQILRGLLTPERVMTQDLATGSYGMASSHAEIFLLSEEGLAAEMEGAINTVIVPRLVEFNFNPSKVIPCRVKIEKIQYDRRRILKEILVEVIRNINTMVKNGKYPGAIPSLKEMSDVLGVPLASFEEEYISIADVDGDGVLDKVVDKGNGKVPKEEQQGDEGDAEPESVEKGTPKVKRQPVKKEKV